MNDDAYVKWSAEKEHSFSIISCFLSKTRMNIYLYIHKYGMSMQTFMIFIYML